MNKIAKWMMAAAMTAIGSAALAQDTQFNVMGQFQGGGTLSGELMINTATGSIDSGSVTVAGLRAFVSSLDGTYTGMVVFGSEPGNGYSFEDLAATPLQISNGPYVFLAEPVTSLVGYIGGPLCAASPCTSSVDGVSSFANLASGSITAGPEIAPVSTASGLTLLLGSLMVLRGRRSVVAA